MKIGRETLKPADRVWVSIGTDRDVVRTVAHVDPRGVGMHHLQPRVLGPKPPSQFFPLLPVES